MHVPVEVKSEHFHYVKEDDTHFFFGVWCIDGREINSLSDCDGQPQVSYHFEINPTTNKLVLTKELIDTFGDGEETDWSIADIYQEIWNVTESNCIEDFVKQTMTYLLNVPIY